MAKRASPAMQLSSLRNRHLATLAELERYRLLVESIQDYAIFMLDPHGYVQTWNRGAEKIQGYLPGEIIGQHFSVFYRQSDRRDGKPQRLLDLAKQYGRVEDEDWRVHKDGSQFWANVTITPLYDSEHGLVGFAKITHDLTDRKRHEDMLRKANVVLRHQQQALEVLNRSKDEFISLASHQLRTPATATKLLLGMLIEGYKGELDPAQAELVRKAYESNERQVMLVNNLLRVAQIDAGKVVLHCTSVSISDLLEDITEEHKDATKKRAQRLELRLPPRPFYAEVDAEYFRMALENLVDNASKYTPEGGRIRITLTTSEDSFAIVIADSGVGIAEADLGLLFEKFKRIPNRLSNTVGGTGLGLYWAQRVIALHGGTIQVASKEDQGTTFTVRVPQEAEDA